MFLPFVDHLTTELSDRLLKVEDRLTAQYLIPSNVGLLSDDTLASIYGTFMTDLPPWDTDEFEAEMRCWTIADMLADINEHVFKCDHLSPPAMPVSTASAERSFISMRRLKTYMSSTMTTGRNF